MEEDLRYLVAVDGGGTGCRARIADPSGAVIGSGQSGPANAMTDPDRAAFNVIEAAELAAGAAGLAPDALSDAKAVIGLAGVNVGDYGERLRRRLPFAESMVLWDAEIAVRGALGPHDGAAAIVGTGSVFGARDGNAVRLVGGWGFLIGDQASGARLGRTLLERTLLAHDGVGSGSALTDAVLKRFDGEAQEIVSFAHSVKPSEFAAFAPQIFQAAEAGDPIALEIVGEGVAAIEASLRAVMPRDCRRICMLGGLAAPYTPFLAESLKAMLHPAQGSALDGAMAIAVERFTGAWSAARS